MLAGAIYVHRISDKRFAGIAGQDFNMFRELCGEHALKNVALVTNMWSAVTREVGEAREKELSATFFKPVLEKGAQMVWHFGTPESAHGAIRKIIAINSLVVLRIQWELVDERKSLLNTSAGKAVNRELEEQVRQHEAEFNRVWEDMQQALKDKDEVARKELEEETRRLQKQMRRIGKDLEGMSANYAVEKERVNVRVKEIEQAPERERQRVEAELVNLSRHLQDVANASMANQVKLEQEMRERERIETEHNHQLADLNHRLQEATNVSANDRAKLDQLVEERERVDAEHKQRLADLTRHLQDETSTSAAHRVALEQEIKELQGRVATTVTVPSHVPPHPIPYVQILLYPATHDG